MSVLRYIGLGALWLTCSLCGVLLAGAPGVQQIPPIPIPITEPPFELSMLLLSQITSAAVAGAVFFQPKTRFLLYGFLLTAISWALVGSTRFPWWLLQSSDNPLRESPSTGTIVLIGLVVASLLQYLLVEALETFRKAAVERGVAPALVRDDLRRIAIHYLSLSLIAIIIGLLLLSVLDRHVADAGWVPELSGDAWGTWILILIAVLLAGVLLMLGRVRGTKKTEEWKPVG